MKLLAQTKLTFIDILIYTCLSVMGFVRLMLNFGTIPTLPIRSNHNKEALKKAYVVGSRINFMINATRFGLQSNAEELSIIQNRLRNIFAFREGYSFGLRLIDYRLLGFLEEDKCSPYELYYALKQWDTNTVYPKWADLPSEIRARLTREMSSNFVVYDL